MPLPTPPLPTGTVDIDGTAVPIRSLSRDEVVRLSSLDVAEAEVLLISSGTSVTPEEATAWRKTVSAPVAHELLERIALLSGIRQPKRAGAEDDPGEA